MRSHTFVLEEWHVPKLEEVALQEKRSVSFIARAIFDRVLPSIIRLSDIDSIVIKATDGETTEGAD